MKEKNEKMSVLKLCVCPFQFQPHFYNRAIIASSMKVTENEGNKKKKLNFLAEFFLFFSLILFFVRSFGIVHNLQSSASIESTHRTNQPAKEEDRKNWLLMHLFSSDERCASREKEKKQQPKFTHRNSRILCVAN